MNQAVTRRPLNAVTVRRILLFSLMCKCGRAELVNRLKEIMERGHLHPFCATKDGR